MAGYSSRRLSDKLGIKPSCIVQIVHEPTDVDLAGLLQPLPDHVRLRRRSGTQPADILVCFAECRRDLLARLPRLRQQVTTAGSIWVVWPKKASERYKQGSGDLTEDVVREQGLAAGLVDVKVCAVDETWSGLKLVRRLKDR